MIDPIQLKEVNDAIDADIQHQQYVRSLEPCVFCKKPASDEMEFETGNGANYTVMIPMCSEHLDELEKTGYDFEEKYADQIQDECIQSQASQAEYERDSQF